MTAYIGFENLANTSNTTGQEMPGYLVENAFDWRTYTHWRSPNGLGNSYLNTVFDEPTEINYWGIAGHNLNIRGSVARMQYLDEEEVWRMFDNGITPVTNAPLLQLAPAVTATAWRIRTWNPDLISSQYGVYTMGNILALPEGIRAPFTPPPVAYDNKYYDPGQKTGQTLGRFVERYGEKMTIKQDQVDPEWIRENWPGLAYALERQPFFYCWNWEEYPEDAVYAWLDEPLSPPHYTSSIHMAFELKCKSLHRIRFKI